MTVPPWVVDTLARYRPYMERFVEQLDHRGLGAFESRWHTFWAALAPLAAKPQNHNVIVVELGTSRSFVDGAFPGCNSDDTKYWDPTDIARWDHGAGLFTYMAAEFLTRNHPKFELYTVDLCASHIARARYMTRPFAYNITYVVSDSVSFLQTFRTKCDLVYLDTGDMTPIEPTAQLQLREAQMLLRENLLAPGAFVLIDDVKNPGAYAQVPGNVLGKAMYSVPYLTKEGRCRIVLSEYQMLLQAPG